MSEESLEIVPWAWELKRVSLGSESFSPWNAPLLVREDSEPEVINRVGSWVPFRNSQIDVYISGGTRRIPQNPNIRAFVEGQSDERYFRQIEHLDQTLADNLQRTRANSFGSPTSLVSGKLTRFMRLADREFGRSSGRTRVEEIRLRRSRSLEHKEAEGDPNYKAYIAEATQLAAEQGACVVAYARGRRIAIGKSLRELKESIPAEYRREDILIQHVPDKEINLRGPTRVST